MQNNLLPAIIPTFRVKEYNSAYDRIFGLDRGWIYCTNKIQKFSDALTIASVMTNTKGLKHTVDIIL